MPGQFQRIGDTVFPDAEPVLPCGLYEWRGTIVDETSEFSIRFICPEGGAGIRQFFVELVLDAWAKKDKEKRQDSDAFLARACEVGYEIVALNNHGPEQRQAYRLAAWLFRNRNAGHMAVTREFKAAADFFDFSNPSSPVLLLPGLGVNQTERRQAGTEAPGTARQLLGEAVGRLRREMARHGEDLPSVTLDFSGVLGFFDRLLRREAPRQATSTPLVCIDKQEGRFILPLLGAADPQTDFSRIEGTVADCLIYGATEFSENVDVLAAHAEEREYLVRQLAQKLLEPGATPEKLDAWLKRVKSDGCLQLIEGGRNLEEDDQEEARELASQMMGAMTWCAYRMMSYCYGVLMEVIAEDLEQSGLTELEGVIFRIEHCQIDLLAGLPLDFLGRAQYRWFVDKWHDFLVAVVRSFSLPDGGHGASNALLGATTRLELFAYLLRQRRDADRLTKRTPAGRITRLTRSLPRDEFHWDYIRQKSVGSSTHPKEIEDAQAEPVHAAIARTDPGLPTYLRSRFCPICGGKIQLEEIIDATDLTRARFWGFCPVCDTNKVYVANLHAMMGTR